MIYKQPGVMMYDGFFRMILALPKSKAGELIHAVARLKLHNEESEFDDPALAAIFEGFRAEMDRDAEKYEAKCKQNASNANMRWHPDGND